MLEHINNKLVITKDIASILTSIKNLRTEIFGVLCGIKDGRIELRFKLPIDKGQVAGLF